MNRHCSVAVVMLVLLTLGGCFDAPLKDVHAPPVPRAAAPPAKAGEIVKPKLKASLSLVTNTASAALHSGQVKGTCMVPEGTVFDLSSRIVMVFTAQFAMLTAPLITVVDSYTFTPETLAEDGSSFQRTLVRLPIKAGAPKPILLGIFKAKISGEKLSFSATVTTKSIGDTSFFAAGMYPYAYDYGQWLLLYTAPQTATMTVQVFASGYSGSYTITAPVIMSLKKQKMTFKY